MVTVIGPDNKNPSSAQSVELVACPACSRQVSSQALSCPNCGHPIASPPTDKWAEISRVGGFVSLAIVAITLGAQAAFLKYASEAIGSDDGPKTLLSVFLQTAPLTISLTIISLVVIKQWVTEFYQILLLSAALLFVSILLGSQFAGLGKVPSFGGNVGTVIFTSLAFYWSRYGPSLFISSLIVGVFLGWVLNKLWPTRTAKPPAKS